MLEDRTTTVEYAEQQAEARKRAELARQRRREDRERHNRELQEKDERMKLQRSISYTEHIEIIQAVYKQENEETRQSGDKPDEETEVVSHTLEYEMVHPEEDAELAAMKAALAEAEAQQAEARREAAEAAKKAEEFKNFRKSNSRASTETRVSREGQGAPFLVATERAAEDLLQANDPRSRRTIEAQGRAEPTEKEEPIGWGKTPGVPPETHGHSGVIYAANRGATGEGGPPPRAAGRESSPPGLLPSSPEGLQVVKNKPPLSPRTQRLKEERMKQRLNDDVEEIYVAKSMGQPAQRAWSLEVTNRATSKPIFEVHIDREQPVSPRSNISMHLPSMHLPNVMDVARSIGDKVVPGRKVRAAVGRTKTC